MATYKQIEKAKKSHVAFSKDCLNYNKEKEILITLDEFSDNSFHILLSEDGKFLYGWFLPRKEEAYKKFSELQKQHIGEIVTVLD